MAKENDQHSNRSLLAGRKRQKSKNLVTISNLMRLSNARKKKPLSLVKFEY